MGWSFHDLFKAVRSILVYAPSIFFSRCVVKVQETEPHKKTVSTAAQKKFLFRLSGRFDFHILKQMNSVLSALREESYLLCCSFSAVQQECYIFQDVSHHC